MRPGVVSVRVDRLLAFAVVDADAARAEREKDRALLAWFDAGAARAKIWRDLTLTERAIVNYPGSLEAECSACDGSGIVDDDGCEECV